MPKRNPSVQTDGCSEDEESDVRIVGSYIGRIRGRDGGSGRAAERGAKRSVDGIRRHVIEQGIKERARPGNIERRCLKQKVA